MERTGRIRGGRREVEEGVVGREVVAVVDTGDVVEIRMLEKRVAIDDVHNYVEDHECKEGEER